mgnify:CR=1 FL=1
MGGMIVRGLRALCTLALLAAAGTVGAQEKFPARPMEMIVPWGPGGGADTIGRLTARMEGRVLSIRDNFTAEYTLTGAVSAHGVWRRSDRRSEADLVKVPLAGLSASWVKAGALYALDRDYLDIGNQCGDIAGKILGGTSASSLAPIFPRKVTYSVNLKTAGAMNLELPQDVVRGATHIFQ